MRYTVIKPFKTLNRKFSTGDVITAEDIDPAGAFTLDDWIARGFVSAESEIAVAPVASKSRFGMSPAVESDVGKA